MPTRTATSTPSNAAAEARAVSNEAIRPFTVEFAGTQLDDLRQRIAATRWPSEELVSDRSQGVQLATIQALARYWTSDYDWRGCEARLNALPQFIDRDRRAWTSTSSTCAPARERAAADHDARLAGLGDRAVEDHRPAHRPDRTRRKRDGRV